MIQTIQIKPLSVNACWQGKRYKTVMYKQYEYALLAQLRKNNIPDGKLKVYFDFGFSNVSADVDNPVKPVMDILQKKYGFNDSRVWMIVSNKHKVKKGEEYVKINIQPYEEVH